MKVMFRAFCEGLLFTWKVVGASFGLRVSVLGSLNFAKVGGVSHDGSLKWFFPLIRLIREKAYHYGLLDPKLPK